jgi:virulence factor Mce-like protein
MNELLTRRFSGAAIGILAIALIVLLFQTQYAPDKDSYTVNVVFGSAGSGLTEASDVKARGVRIGSVDELSFVDGRAVGVIRIDGDVQLPAQDLVLVVTAKTLLGEKQVELSFPDERFGQAPFLADNAMLRADQQPTELNEVLDTLEPFLASINAEELATIVTTLSEQSGEADTFGENLELATQLAEFGARTADQTLNNLEDLTKIAQALRPSLDGSFDRTRAALPEATRLLRENPDDIETALLALSGFSIELSELLEVEEGRIATLFETGEPVGAMLEQNAAEIGSLVEGLSIYFRLIGGASGLLDDSTVFAYFRLFVSEQSQDEANPSAGAGQ